MIPIAAFWPSSRTWISRNVPASLTSRWCRAHSTASAGIKLCRPAMSFAAGAMNRSATNVFSSQVATLARNEWIITETLTVIAAATASAAMVTALRWSERTRCCTPSLIIQLRNLISLHPPTTAAGTPNEVPAIRNPIEAKPRYFPPPRNAAHALKAASRSNPRPGRSHFPDRKANAVIAEPGWRMSAGLQAAASDAGCHDATSEAQVPTANASATCDGVMASRPILTSV